MKTKVLVLCFTALIASPANAGPLDGIFGALDRAANGVISGVTRSPTFVNLSAPAKAGDKAALALALNRAVQSGGRTAQALTEARPRVEQTLMTFACATDARALNSLNQIRIAPSSFGENAVTDSFIFPMSNYNIKYHDTRTCMQIARIADLKQDALNALSFTAFYLSPSSGEAKSQWFSFRKVDGDWHLDEFYNIS